MMARMITGISVPLQSSDEGACILPSQHPVHLTPTPNLADTYIGSPFDCVCYLPAFAAPWNRSDYPCSRKLQQKRLLDLYILKSPSVNESQGHLELLTEPSPDSSLTLGKTVGALSPSETTV